MPLTNASWSTQRWLPTALATGVIPDAIVDADHTIAYLKYAATRSLFTPNGSTKNSTQRLSSVGRFASQTLPTLNWGGPLQASLKKIMTMLGRVRRRQADDDPTLEQARPAFTNRSTDFYKAVMVQAQRARLEYVLIQTSRYLTDVS